MFESPSHKSNYCGHRIKNNLYDVLYKLRNHTYKVN